MSACVELRCGDWRDVLADVECDTLICDPPYGERTHKGQRHGRKDKRYTEGDYQHLVSWRGLEYSHWSPWDVREFVESWSARTRGWMAILTSHDLIDAYQDAYEVCGRYAFAPLACVQTHMNVRLAGDGPSNWTVYLMVSRPRTKAWSKWGALRGAYVGSHLDPGENFSARGARPCAGGKPVWLMSQIIEDYSRRGDLICDPCAGGATTLLAARQLGRSAIGAEVDPDTYAKAQARLAEPFTRSLVTLADLECPGIQADLFGEDE